MRIETICSVRFGNTILTEKERAQNSISSTEKTFEHYFENYGYEFVGIHNMSEKLVIVKKRNTELAQLTCDDNRYEIIDYTTCEVVQSNVNQTMLLNAHKPRLKYVKHSNSSQIDTEIGEPLGEVFYIAPTLLLYYKHGIPYIYEITTNQKYSLIEKEATYYYGNGDKFVDMKYGVIRPFCNIQEILDFSKIDIDEIIAEYPFGQIRDRLFHLLDWPVSYGIQVDRDDNIDQMWYDSASERDTALARIYSAVDDCLASEKQKKH